MKLSAIVGLLDGEALTPIDAGLEIVGACASSLMSDVLASVRAGAILLTGLCSNQVIRTAQVTDIVAIVFVNGKRPPPDMVTLARDEQVLLIRTALPMFEACGRLHEAGLAAACCTLAA